MVPEPSFWQINLHKLARQVRLMKNLRVGDPNKAVYTVREICQIFGISRTFVARLIEEGKLPGVRFGPRCVRVPKTAIERILRISAHENSKVNADLQPQPAPESNRPDDRLARAKERIAVARGLQDSTATKKDVRAEEPKE
jgi:excisionase family DNA binding protein